MAPLVQYKCKSIKGKNIHTHAKWEQSHGLITTVGQIGLHQSSLGSQINLMYPLNQLKHPQSN